MGMWDVGVKGSDVYGDQCGVRWKWLGYFGKKFKKVVGVLYIRGELFYDRL